MFRRCQGFENPAAPTLIGSKDDFQDHSRDAHMSEQDPPVNGVVPDERTLFRAPPLQPSPRPIEDEPTLVSGRPSLEEDRTIVRPGTRLRRAGSVTADLRPDLTSPIPPRRSAVESMGLEAPNRNAFLRAASPLLLLLGRLRTFLLRTTESSLVAHIASGVEDSERGMRAAGLAEADIERAKFILCVTADEVLGNLPRDENDASPSPEITTRFFGKVEAGRKFLDEVDRLRENPTANYDLLELTHACLTLCFQGGRSCLLGGPATLQDLRQDLEDHLSKARPARSLPLSPRWKGQKLPSRSTRLQIPLWAAASVVGLVLFVTFVAMRVSLGSRAEMVASAFLDLEPQKPTTFGSVAAPAPIAPPPAPAQILQFDHIAQMLGPHLASGAIELVATPNAIILRIGEKTLFQPGKADVLEQSLPLLMRVAHALDDSSGAVKIIGHHDPSSIVGPRLASSFELSRERAKNVAALLGKSLSDPGRLSAEGKGADQPVASNETLEGRDRNRRIDIVVARTDRHSSQARP
jgi:type VI secretion system protein ImpK